MAQHKGGWFGAEGGQIEVGCEGEAVDRESGEVLEQLPREAVDAPSIRGGVEGQVDGALGSLGWSEMWRLVALCVAGGWIFMILEVPSNPSHSVML